MSVNDAKPTTAHDNRSRLFHDALSSPEPTWELRGTLRTLLAFGHDRAELERELTGLMLDFRTAGQDREEDVVYDVLHDLVGWCSPGAELCFG